MQLILTIACWMVVAGARVDYTPRWNGFCGVCECDLGARHILCRMDRPPMTKVDWLTSDNGGPVSLF